MFDQYSRMMFKWMAWYGPGVCSKCPNGPWQERAPTPAVKEPCIPLGIKTGSNLANPGVGGARGAVQADTLRPHLVGGEGGSTGSALVPAWVVGGRVGLGGWSVAKANAMGGDVITIFFEYINREIAVYLCSTWLPLPLPSLCPPFYVSFYKHPLPAFSAVSLEAQQKWPDSDRGLGATAGAPVPPAPAGTPAPPHTHSPTHPHSRLLGAPSHSVSRESSGHLLISEGEGEGVLLLRPWP